MWLLWLALFLFSAAGQTRRPERLGSTPTLTAAARAAASPALPRRSAEAVAVWEAYARWIPWIEERSIPKELARHLWEWRDWSLDDVAAAEDALAPLEPWFLLMGELAREPRVRACLERGETFASVRPTLTRVRHQADLLYTRALLDASRPAGAELAAQRLGQVVDVVQFHELPGAHGLAVSEAALQSVLSQEKLRTLIRLGLSPSLLRRALDPGLARLAKPRRFEEALAGESRQREGGTARELSARESNRVQDTLWAHATWIRMLRVALALEEHNEIHGAWPRELQELRPLFGGCLPADPASGSSFRYALSADGWTLSPACLASGTLPAGAQREELVRRPLGEP